MKTLFSVDLFNMFTFRLKINISNIIQTRRELRMQSFYLTFLKFYMLLIYIFYFSTDEHLKLMKG